MCGKAGLVLVEGTGRDGVSASTLDGRSHPPLPRSFPPQVAGRYLAWRGPAPAAPEVSDPLKGRELWETAEKLTGWPTHVSLR